MNLIFIFTLLAFVGYLVVLSYNPARVYFEPHFYGKGNSDIHLKDGMSVLTYNASTAHIKIFGLKVYEPIPFYQKRFLQLPERIREYSPDIVCIQETYKIEDKDFLITALKNDYPYSIYYSRKSNFKIILDCGLVILSKFPITKHHFELFTSYPFDEGLIVRKGFLHTELKAGDKSYHVINTHLTVGGIFFNTESDKANTIREEQIEQILNYIKTNGLTNVLFTGDFNTGPQVSEYNYRLVLENNFIDPLNSNTKNSEIITWDPENRLNKKSYFDDSPPQRVDHIFIDKSFSSLFSLDFVKLFGLLPIVDVGKNRSVTISDHYGILLNFKKKP